MKKEELIRALESLRVHPGKKLGQNFLVDANLLDFIFRTAKPQKGDMILEVGPGFGCLTRKLVESGAQVVAIELDKRIAEYVEKNVVAPNFRLVRGDACKLDLESLICEFRKGAIEKSAWKCVANLPYSISTPFIMKVVRMRNPPVEMQLLLQKETAERFAAKPSTKAYGAVSVIVQSVYNVSLVRNVPPQVFHPPPKVMSALSNFSIRNHDLGFEFEKYVAFVKAAFSFRRKKLLNNLSQCFTEASLLAALDKLEFSACIRAEELSAEKFMELYSALAQNTNPNLTTKIIKHE